jgi:hypothetical protein
MGELEPGVEGAARHSALAAGDDLSELVAEAELHRELGDRDHGRPAEHTSEGRGELGIRRRVR